MALIVIVAGPSAGQYERGDILDFFPDGTDLGRGVTIANGFAVVRLTNVTVAQIQKFLERHSIRRTLEEELDRRGIVLTPEKIERVKAVLGDEVVEEIKFRRWAVDYQAIPKSVRDRILTGEVLEVSADQFEPFLIDKLAQAASPDGRDR